LSGFVVYRLWGGCKGEGCIREVRYDGDEVDFDFLGGFGFMVVGHLWLMITVIKLVLIVLIVFWDAFKLLSKFFFMIFIKYRFVSSMKFLLFITFKLFNLSLDQLNNFLNFRLEFDIYQTFSNFNNFFHLHLPFNHSIILPIPTIS
jgi:hypothetical protein